MSNRAHLALGTARVLALTMAAVVVLTLCESAPALAFDDPAPVASQTTDGSADPRGVDELPDVELTDPADPPVIAPDPEADVDPDDSPHPAPHETEPGESDDDEGQSPPPMARGSIASNFQDLTSDGVADLLARDSEGKLWTYPGTSTGGFAARVASGNGWLTLDQVHIVGNWNGTGGNDVIARKPSTGQLFLYPGNGAAGFSSGIAIGTGWNGLREIEPVGDLSGDGHPDLIALHRTDGKIYIYPGNGTGGFKSAYVLGTGFGGYDALVGAGDWNGDVNPDLFVRASNGQLHALYGKDNGTVEIGGPVGVGWGPFTAFVGGADRNGDRKADLLVRRNDGLLFRYNGNGSGGFGQVTQVGNGWNGMTLEEPVPAQSSPPPPTLQRPTINEPTDGTSFPAGGPVEIAGTGTPATTLLVSDAAGSSSVQPDAQGRWSVSWQRSPGTYVITARHVSGTTQGPAHTVSYTVSEPEPEPEPGMSEAPVPHAASLAGAIGTVDPLVVPTQTPTIVAAAVDEGRDAVLAGEDVSGGAPASERPIIGFEAELWTDSAQPARLHAVSFAGARTQADVPSLSTGQVQVPDGVLADGDTFRLRVRSTWAAAPATTQPHSDWTAWRTYVVRLRPSAPQNVSPTNGSRQTTPRPQLEAHTPAGRPVTGTFEVLNDEGWRVEMGSTSVTSTGLLQWRPTADLPSGSYTWRVAASNVAGASDWSTVTSFTVATPPPAPTDVAAEGFARKARVTWRGIDNASTVTQWVVTALPDGPSLTLPWYYSSAWFPDLEGGRDWTFSVRAENANGLSEPAVSAPVHVGLAPPGVPANVRAESRVGGVTLGWEPPRDAGDRPVSGYIVRYGPQSSTSVSMSEISTTDLSVAIDDLLPRQQYVFEISAVSSAGPGHPTHVYARPYTTPGAPTNVIVRPGDGVLDVRWNAPTDNGANWIHTYTVTVTPGDHSLAVESYYFHDGVRLEGLDNGVDYTVTVTATNDAGDGPPSSPVGPINPVSGDTDTDLDGLPDVVEFRAGSNHLIVDTDGDGLNDRYEGLELAGLTSPVSADTDADGVPDGAADVDEDGLTNVEERDLGTDPAAPDSDGDGLSDAAEAATSTDPLVADSDGDQLSDGLELEYGLDPNEDDTDGDTVLDADEVVQRTPTFEEVIYGDTLDVSVTARATPAVMQKLRVESSAAAALPSALTPTAVVTVPSDVSVESPSPVVVDTLTLPLMTVAGSTELAVVASSGSGGWSIADNDFIIAAGANAVEIDSVEVGVRYAVVDLADWRARLRGCDLARGAEGVRLDVQVILDETQSVASADPSDERFVAVKTVLRTLAPGDSVDVRAFGWLWTSAGFGGYVEGEPDIRFAGPPGYVSVADALELVEAVEANPLDYSFLDNYNWDVNEPRRADHFLTYQGGRQSAPARDSECRQQAIILVTDGASEPVARETPEAPDHVPFTQRTEPPVHVLDVGQGGAAAQWLMDVAARTGGSYSHVPTLDPEIAWDRTDEVPPTGTHPGLGQDLDEDGLEDWIEREGVTVFVNTPDGQQLKRVRTDPTLRDSDDDGLTDGEEMGRQLTAAELGGWNSTTPITIFEVVSHALESDGDQDGISDAEELEQELDPLDFDMDVDTISDGEEMLYGSAPDNRNSDGDEYDDHHEFTHLSEGLDPTVFNERVDKMKWAEDVATGFICGEWNESCQVYSIGWLVGNIASGVLIFGDVRDLIATASQGRTFDAIMSAVGLVPYLGDAAKAIHKIVNVLPHLSKADEAGALRMMDKFDDGAACAARAAGRMAAASTSCSKVIDAFRELDPDLIDDLRGLGIGDQALRKLLTKNSLEHLRRLVNHPNRLDYSYPAGVRPKAMPGGRFNGHVAEQATQQMIGPTSVLTKRCTSVVVIPFKARCRYVDVTETLPNGQQVLHEVKTGFVSGRLSRSQIEKDRVLNQESGTEVVWHFYASTTGKIGASEETLNRLTTAGINFYVHFPG